MLCLLEKLLDRDEFRSEIAELKGLSLSVTRQLNAWLDSLKKTTAVGHRHQTPKRRETIENGKRRDDFLAYLKQVQDEYKDKADRTSEEIDDTD